MTTRYEVREAPGTYDNRAPLVISAWPSAQSAVNAAHRSDRLVAVDSATGATIYRPPMRGGPKGEAGRYGRGPRRGEYAPVIEEADDDYE